MRHPLPTAAALFLLMLLAPGLSARADVEVPAEVEGRVRMYGTQEALPHARALLRGPEGQVHALALGADGSWAAVPLPAGAYLLEVTAEGFMPLEAQVVLTPGRRKRLDVQLHTELVDSVEVTAPAGGKAQLLTESPEAVAVVRLDVARERSADLGDVLRRTEGVAVQRPGGLGTQSTLSLNGLSGSQVRTFVDGVPLELAGWGEDVGSVPVPLLERVEVYKGVVPLRLGADALGGALNLVSDERTWNSFAHASLQLGSYGTARLTAAARKAPGPSGLFASARVSLDTARNDYRVDVEAPDAQGRVQPLTVRRFHDGYRALSGGVEAGVAARPWADVLALRAGHARSAKELQHGPLMSVPYGEAESASEAWSLQARYRKLSLWGGRADVEALAHASWRRLSLRDAATFVYDWRGERVRERRVAGEMGEPRDAWVVERGVFGRAGLGLQLAPAHRLQLTSSPQVTRRRGDDRLDEVEGARDVLNEPQLRASLVSGVGWDARLLGGVLESSFFVKHYWLTVRADQEVRFGELEAVRRTDRAWGVGEGVRLRLTDALALKASYEWATRLPSADEAFGDGVLVAANPELEPERGHNLNATLQWVRPQGPLGAASAEATAFARLVKNQVALMRGELAAQHQNVLGARALGVEGALRWVTPGGRLEASASASYTDLRNTSRDGAFAPYRGDRIPNRPFLFAAAELRGRLDGPLPGDDAVRPFLASRYTHRFFRGWESLGASDTKQVVPAQWVQDAGVTWALPTRGLTATIEVRNLLDARTYDVVGVQGPGRAFALTLASTLDLSGDAAPAPE
ncbi:MAG TPA: TonB-dependent receptor [Myxococcaceae bacterium]|jgi:outer membrane receptor protein involved in Fe transport